MSGEGGREAQLAVFLKLTGWLASLAELVRFPEKKVRNLV